MPSTLIHRCCGQLGYVARKRRPGASVASTDAAREALVNPNKALWEKGDFTRTAQALRKAKSWSPGSGVSNYLADKGVLDRLARACLTTSKRNVGFSR